MQKESSNLGPSVAIFWFIFGCTQRELCSFSQIFPECTLQSSLTIWSSLLLILAFILSRNAIPNCVGNWERDALGVHSLCLLISVRMCRGHKVSKIQAPATKTSDKTDGIFALNYFALETPKTGGRGSTTNRDLCRSIKVLFTQSAREKGTRLRFTPLSGNPTPELVALHSLHPACLATDTATARAIIKNNLPPIGH